MSFLFPSSASRPTGAFFSLEFQQAMRRNFIKFRPNRSGAPHLNWKVERSQKTDKIKFYLTVDLKEAELGLRLEDWQFDYNWHRPHISLGGKTPVERCYELTEQMLLNEEVADGYDPDKEHFHERVRLPREIRQMWIPSLRPAQPGAINLPPDRVGELAPQLLPEKSAEIVVYCASPT